MTALVPVPPKPEAPPFPTMADRPAGTYNAKAFAWADYMGETYGEMIAALAEATRTNALVALEQGTAAGTSAATATAQADLAMGYRNSAQASANVATTQAGLAGDERAAAVLARLGAQAAQEGAEDARDESATILTDVQTFGGELLVATSTTNLTPGAGNKSFAIQPNKGYDVGMYLIATSAGASGNRMAGTVVSYNRSTGALVLAVDAFAGSAARADWVIGVGARDGGNGMTTQVVSGVVVCVANVHYIVDAAGAALTAPTSWAPRDRFGISEAIGAGEYTVDYGTTPVRGRVIGVATIQASRAEADWLYQDTTRGLI